MLATADYNVIWEYPSTFGFSRDFSISRKTKLKKWEWPWRSFFFFFFIFYYSRDTLDENLDDRWILFDKSWEILVIFSTLFRPQRVPADIFE